MIHRTLLVSITILSMSGCKESGDAAEGGAAAAPAPASIDLAAINAAVPKELSAAVAFTRVSADDDRIVAAVPGSWETGHIPGRYRPSRDADLGFFTAFGVGSSCDGTCAPKDWKATADKVEFAQFTGGDFDVAADEMIEGGRFLRARKDDTLHLVFAWWRDGAPRYFFCRATLEDRAVAAAAAFEKACRSMIISTWE